MSIEVLLGVQVGLFDDLFQHAIGHKQVKEVHWPSVGHVSGTPPLI